MSTSSSSKRPLALFDEIIYHFDQSLEHIYPELYESCGLSKMEREAREKYGDDYQCSNVLRICTKLRSEDPAVFLKTGSEDIAKLIVKNLPKSDMIPEVSFRNGGFLTFKLSWEWMAKRINNMLTDGIQTWGPVCDVRRAVVLLPENAIGSNVHADEIRAYFIKETLSFMFMYSDVEVYGGEMDLVEERLANTAVGKRFLIEQGVFKKRSARMHEPPLLVAAKTEERVSNEIAFRDLAKLWVGIRNRKADCIIYLAPVRRGGYIERCLDAARDVQWLNDKKDIASYCGYKTSSNEKEKLNCLLEEFRNYSKAASIVELGKAVGYETAEAVFEFALKYAYLKNNLLAEVPLSIDELFDEKENTFVYLLHTQALVLSILKNPRRGTFKLTKAFLAKERELASLLVRFTDEVRMSCLTISPHMLCEYLWELCKEFTSCYGEVRPVETRLLLCRATSVVMGKCFELLGINTNCSSGYLLQQMSASSLAPVIVNPFIPWSADVSDARLKNLNPRIELFSIFVSIDADFKEGHLFGGIALTDFNGLQNGWLKSDNKDSSLVTYFSRDWCNPLAIRNESYIYFGNPSSRYGVSLASTIEIHTELIVAFKKNGARKDACFELSRGKKEFKKSSFWQNEDKRTECGSMAFKSKTGFIQIHYIMLKDAMDATIELSFESHIPRGLKVCGHISAYYGKDVLNECEDEQKVYYHALIFKTDGMWVFPGKKLGLRKSVLAIPANGDLILEASLKDSKSGETIVDAKVTYSVVTNNGLRKWKMPAVKGIGKNGKSLGSFNLTLEWSKGTAIVN